MQKKLASNPVIKSSPVGVKPIPNPKIFVKQSRAILKDFCSKPVENESFLFESGSDYKNQKERLTTKQEKALAKD
ncbi:hypothetical protein [Enterococcus faecalis]|uniref:hypothetical protein n=1 Tax=Enterococcus faecalis TaxID=1351 RepID=UPI001F418DEB|nr:hypothetical protein [Enterococcus faecalis]